MSANEPEPDSRAQPSDLVQVALGARSYDIVVGSSLLADAGDHIAPLLTIPRTILVTDENVAPLYQERVAQSLARHGIACDSIIVAPGEGSKSFANLQDLLERLLAGRAERGLTLLALGGGVIGDLVGFAASVLLRGVDVIQLPTTLLAQIDSSVGGKTGINSRHGKNLIGSFHQPRLVLADSDALDSLASREMAAGYAEMVKYGLIDDASFFAWLEANGGEVLAGDDAARRHAIAHCCRAKARIVAEDEQEQGRRALLNLGHTFAHAFEAECGYSDALLHGEAVSIGMVLAFRLSHRLGLCGEDEGARMAAHLAAHGL
ncbi:MAG TPA: 3-dehydroquinate synthase, partial [Alphaproteobacteria bacterium]|nr:3-dehydroquinate synthase [Alphaproteobacteria bacterium]